MSKSPIGWLRNTKSIVLLGLDTAGKSTFLNQWARGVTALTTTTIGLDIEHVEVANEILLEIGKKNGMSPSYIYKLIKTTTQTKKVTNKSAHKDDSTIPSRLGRKTLQELSDMGKIELDKAIAILNAKGLMDITADSKIKNIADDLDMMPIDIYKLLTQ